MSPYRATDEQLDREIAALERIARVRLRRATQELAGIDRDLREMRRERARRRGTVPGPAGATEAVPDPATA
ncbi:MAG TPA: hypothetical protein VMG36_01910 [Thermoplasmata archaeon]|nr:hypothetical protein [Thermoplasmata archaeon]